MSVGKRQRQKQSDDLETLLNALSVAELRVALSRLEGRTTQSEDQTKAGVAEAIRNSGKSQSSIKEALYDVQAETPFSHCLIAGCDPSAFRAVSNRRTKKIEDRRNNFRHVHTLVRAGTIYITFEREIEVVNWVANESKTIKRKEALNIVQPLVVRFRENSKAVTVSFPGFNQGYVDEDKRVAYEDELTELLALVDVGIGIAAHPLPIAASINRLLDAKSTRLVRVSTDLFNPAGSLRVTSHSKNAPAEDALVKLLTRALPRLTPEQLRRAVTSGMTDSDAKSIELLWIDERVFTRMEFWPIGCDCLWVWQGTYRDYATIDSVVDLLLGAMTFAENNNDAIWDRIVSMEPNAMIRLADLSAMFARPNEEVRALLIAAVRAGLLTPTYRLIAEERFLTEIGKQFWEDSLPSLARTFKAEDGKTIDGRNPKHVEVAFRRRLASVEPASS